MERFKPLDLAFGRVPVMPLPWRLGGNRLFILPTRYGLVFFMVLAVMLVGSINYGNNLGFLLAFLLGAMSFIGLLHTFRNLSGVQLFSIRADPVFCGQTAFFSITVQAPGKRRSALSFRFQGQDATLADLAADVPTVVEVPVQSPSRGLCRPGVLVVESHYPMGLFRCWSRMHFDVACVVYPKPLPAALPDDPGGFGDGGQARETISGVDDFVGLRHYQPGDSLQHLSWKALSREQGLLTKVFSGTAGAFVVIDWQLLKDNDVERRLSMLCHMVLYAHGTHLVYGLRLPGKEIGPGQGLEHYRQCLNALALY